MRLLTRVLAGLSVAAASISATAAEPAGRFHFKGNDWPITFSSEKTPDTLSIEIDGPSCEKALIRFQIRGASGEERYRYEGPYSKLVGSDCSEKAAMRFIVEDNMELMLGGGHRLPLSESSGVEVFKRLVPDETYERLSAAHA